MDNSDLDVAMRALAASGIAVLVLNDSLSPTYANAAAQRMLNFPVGTLPARVRPDELLSVARRAMRTNESIEASVSLDPRTEARVWAHKLEEERIVLVMTDITREVQAHHLRRQFVLAASHELKTPVAGLQALAETVNEALDDDTDAARRFARSLLVESQRLGQLVDDLLDLSRVEDPAHFSDASVDLAAVSEREAEGLRGLADERRVKLAIDVSGGAVVRGDEQQLGLLARNLIDNAIRYTPGDGSVQVTVLRNRTEVVLEVEDTGAGIPLNAQSRVFERFFRVEEDRARTSGGTGLGLSIVKHVAELHGGRVSLRSELGEGSTFTVQLPLAAEGR